MGEDIFNNMKQEVRTQIGETLSLSWYSDNIDNFLEKIQAFKDCGANHIDISAEDDYGSTSVYLIAEERRQETDEEYSARLQKESAEAEAKLRIATEKERQLYENLKKKFEPK